MTKEQKIVKLARQMALAQLNKNRQEDNLPVSNSISPLWWKMYRDEWIQVARTSSKFFPKEAK